MLRFPLKFVGITQGFNSIHTAIDMGWNNSYGGKNADVFACGFGEVIEVVDNKDNTLIPNMSGNYVTIKYDDNIKVRVCHLLKNSIKVKKGDKVTKDKIIAKMGNSGYCGINKAYHTHVIVFKDNKRVNPLDYLYFDKNFNVLAKTNTFNIKYINLTEYIQINTKSGVWSRHTPSLKGKKFKAIPNGTICELISKDIANVDNYKWDLIIYKNELVYLPNKWNKYLQK